MTHSQLHNNEPGFSWGSRRRFNAYSEFMQKKLGGRVQKLTIDAGFSCPNRDGTKGYGGCTFCLNAAFNPSYCDPQKSVHQQIEEGITFHAARYRRAISYLAYFQAFSNTYASVDVLYRLYRQALDHPSITGLVIGTRPDCVDEEKLDLLQKLSRDHFIAVEYGIESVYNTTLQRVHRCHTIEETAGAIWLTARRGLHVGGHLIFGLPGESRTDMLNSAEIISDLPIDSVKFHQLQIFKGTVMAREYVEKPDDFYHWTEAEYLHFVVDYVERLNPRIVVERIAGETPPRYAFQKPWGPRYDQLLIKFEKLMEQQNTWQGKKWVNRAAKP